MSRHPNATLIRKALRAVAHAETEALKQLCSDEIHWHAAGHTPWAGDHQGFEAVLDYLGRVGEAADVFEADLTDLLVSEERAATVMQVSARRGDRRLDVPFLILYQIAEGKIAKVWSTPLDLHAADVFWADL
jgi:ketosteroid isomerase-like protein